MRRFLLFFLCLHLLNKSFAVVKTWVGTGGNKQWSNAANWSPSAVPTSIDDVVINISDSIHVDPSAGFVSSTLNLNSIKISNNASVILSYIQNSATGTTRNIVLASVSTSPYGLEIESGCILSVNANFIYSGTGAGTLNYNLSLTGNSGVTGLINGELQFRGYITNTGGGNGGCAARLDVFAGASSFSNLNVFGKIIYYPNTGNSSSATTAIMKAGSFYEIRKNGGSFPNWTWEPTSTARSLGMATNGPLFIGNTYGNLEWNSPSQTSNYPFNLNLTFNNVNIISSGSSSIAINTSTAVSTTRTFNINGNLNVNTGCLLQLVGSSVPSGSGTQLNLNGNLTNNGIIYSSGNVGTINNFDFASSLNQNISGTGTFNNTLVLRMNGTGGSTLLNDVTLANNGLHFLNGKINCNSYILTIPSIMPIISNSSSSYTNLNAAGYTNFGTDNSYVFGKLKITGLSAVTKKAFPVGSSTTHRPIFLNNATGDFTVEYNTGNPRTTFNNVMNAGLDHISSQEYWDINCTSGSAGVELSFYDPNSGGVTNMNELRVAHYNGTQWDDVSQLPATANVTYFGTAGSNGSILSSLQTSFSPFTLASSTINNPLPVKDIQLSITNINSNVKLNWNVVGDEEVNYYTVEKSNDGIHFTAINTINAQRITGNASYTFNDFNNSKTYYRIKATLLNNQIAYSKIVLSASALKNVLVYPNPTKDELQIIAPFNSYTIIIFDVFGNKILQEKSFNRNAIINVKHFASGLYNIQLVSKNKEIISNKFVKE